MQSNIKYAAEIDHVREVSLAGTADATFWTDLLARENLVPTTVDGQAQLVISAVESKFKGIKFRELVFSVCTQSPDDGNKQGGCFLLQAFNTCRIFAWFERNLFSTPYDHGTIEMDVQIPASFQLIARGTTVFGAGMPAAATRSTRPPSRSGDEAWFGPVFLPSRGRNAKASDKLFYARLAGTARAYPFLAGTDAIGIKPAPEAPVLQWLVDSHFTPVEWLIREDATHAKSKTYRRDAAPQI